MFMTPLDCALQRGFRSTAKYLQLHGGVPATRLTGPAMEAQVNSSMSLQIRDDVTFWGDSSTESEEDKKSAKKVHKRKVSMRNRKKKTAQSESDAEAVKAEKKVVTTVNSSTNTITSESPQKTAGSSRINYSNEITINGRTEISVHQTQEIIVDGEGPPNNSSPGRKVEIDTTETIVLPAEDKEKRPKSAKVNKFEPEEEPQMGQSTDDTTMDTVIDTHKLKTEMKVATLELPDISNTSEETEGPKELIVEASVHPEPTKMTTTEEVKEEPQVKSILKTTEPSAEKAEEIVEHPQVHAPTTGKDSVVNEATTESKVVQIEEEKPVDMQVEEKQTITEAVRKEEVLEELAKNLVETATELVQQPEVKIKRKEPEPIQTEKQELTSKSPKKTAEPFKDHHKPTKEMQKPDPKRKQSKTRFKKTEQPAIIKIFKTDEPQSEEIESTPSEIVSDSMEQASKSHKSFKVLSERQAKELQIDQKRKMKEDEKKPRSKSDDTKFRGVGKQFRGSKIPTVLSKSERQLDTLMERDRRTHSEIETRIPSLPNIHASTRDRYVLF